MTAAANLPKMKKIVRKRMPNRMRVVGIRHARFGRQGRRLRQIYFRRTRTVCLDLIYLVMLIIAAVLP